jgi:two-component system, sensor histidine kinase and response regulator
LGFVESDVVTILSDAVEFYQPVAELRGISLSLLLCSQSEVLAVVDPLLLAQAIGNLIDNALKYAQENGEVEVSLCEREERVDITVSDDGPGIPAAERPKVTERFYRGDRSRGTPGVGLGLALVNAVATLHRGSLDFTDNEPGVAATMSIHRAS